MKDKEKQIEMEKTMRKVYEKYGVVSLVLFAEELYNAGYRKLPKDSVVLSREEYELLTNDLDKGDYGEFESGFSQGYETGSKETAEKIIEDIRYTSDHLSGREMLITEAKLNELAKQFGVEIKE